MRLSDILKVEGICIDLATPDKDGALHALAAIMARTDATLDEATVYRALAERERLATTGVGSGIAIPHGRADIDAFRIAMGISRKGVPFDAVDGGPAHILVAVLAPLQNPADQLRMLARISRVLKDHAVRKRLLEADSNEAAFAIIVAEERRG